MIFSILTSGVAAMTAYLQYEARWWRGMLWGVLLVIVSLGFVISGLDQDYSSPYDLTYPAMYLLAVMGFLIAVTSAVTVMLRGGVKRKTLVLGVFLIVLVALFGLGWITVFSTA